MSENKFESKADVIDYLEAVANYGLSQFIENAETPNQLKVAQGNYEAMFEAIEWIEEEVEE